MRVTVTPVMFMPGYQCPVLIWELHQLWEAHTVTITFLLIFVLKIHMSGLKEFAWNQASHPGHVGQGPVCCGLSPSRPFTPGPGTRDLRGLWTVSGLCSPGSTAWPGNNPTPQLPRLQTHQDFYEQWNPT